MKSKHRTLNYTFINFAGMAIVWLWLFLDKLFQSGWPQYPLYYLGSAVEIGLAVLTYKLLNAARVRGSRGLLAMVSLFSLLCFFTPRALSNYKTGILWQVGGSEFWYLLSVLLLFMFRNGKNRIWRTASPGEPQVMNNIEAQSKGVVLMFVTLGIIMLFAFGIVMLIVSFAGKG